MDEGENPYVVRIMAHVDVQVDGGGPPDEAVARAIHGTTSDSGVGTGHPELREMGLRGGRVLLTYFDLATGCWATAEHEFPRPLGDDELDLLKRRTNGDWSDGVIAGFLEDLRDCLGLPVQVNWRGPLLVEQFQGQTRRFAPWSPLARACWQGNLEEARAALAAGGDANANPDGLPILHGAIVSGHVGVAQLLIESGADVRGKDVLDVQRDPLWTCVTCRRCRVSDDTVLMARLLLERGAKPSGGYRGNPLDVARRRRWDRMARLLEEFATPPRSPDGTGPTFRAGDRVRICAGPFSGMLGWVEQGPRGDAATPATVRIEIFGKAMVVEVPVNELYPLAPQVPPRSSE